MPETAQRPYRTYAYDLTSADALAWRRLRNDWSAGELAFGFVLIALIGAALAFLPEPLVGSPYGPRFIAVLAVAFAFGYGLFRLVIDLNDRRLARRDIPLARQVILEDWVDHLDERWEGGRRSVALEMMGPVLETPDHVFVQGPSAVIIMPAAAFGSPAEKKAFAANLEEMADDWAATLEAKG